MMDAWDMEAARIGREAMRLLEQREMVDDTCDDADFVIEQLQQIFKPRASVRLWSEQSPYLVPSHCGAAVMTFWYLEVEGVRIGYEHFRRKWTDDRHKYTEYEHAPPELKTKFEALCAAFDGPGETVPPGSNVEPVEIPGELEMFEGKLTKVVDASRTGWWRFHAHRDRDGYCDNPARGY